MEEGELSQDEDFLEPGTNIELCFNVSLSIYFYKKNEFFIL
jgi:hypothetical protein